MLSGKTNIVAGFLFLALFMIYGFALIFLRDFAPRKEQWIADDAVGKHFESRLAQAHGNLFALINVAVGLALLCLQVPRSASRWIFGLALAAILMPSGILAEVFFAAPPVFVIVGGISMTLAMAWIALAISRLEVSQ